MECGVVGAICINVDANYLTEEVIKDQQRIEAWFKRFCRTDMQVGEIILSKDENAKALKGQAPFQRRSVLRGSEDRLLVCLVRQASVLVGKVG
jgi:hypothetical protein